MQYFLSLFLMIVNLYGMALAATPYFEELETLNPVQRSALQKLKTAIGKLSVPHDWMKENIYLVKYLQVTNFNSKKAEDMIKETIKFRKEAKVDKWEDPSYFADFEADGKNYPNYYGGFDRKGRPIVESYYGEWDVRAAAMAGKIKHLGYYAVRNIERATRRIRELQSEGKNVTQWNLIVNMDGFNLISQACPTCLPLYLAYTNYYEKYWPNSVHRFVFLNTPSSFEGILNLVRPLMSPQTRKVIKVFGTKKSSWKPYLDDLVDPTEISDWYDAKGKDRRSS